LAKMAADGDGWVRRRGIAVMSWIFVCCMCAVSVQDL
jgi:hypothetical protein